MDLGIGRSDPAVKLLQLAAANGQVAWNCPLRVTTLNTSVLVNPSASP